ncbi:MAG TPA: imidazole glycerol phosphate synthase subunit HisH [Chloroflexota bacterium]
MIAIVDYCAGNLRSVARAVEQAGVSPLVTSEAEAVARADALILPGVGAAADTMANLRSRGLVEPLREYLASGRPFLGVCMGLQALLAGSEEAGWHECLGVVPGRVRRFPTGLTVPHMGWNQVVRRREHPVFAEIPNGANFYFVHSYYCAPEDDAVVLATTEYGQPFPSVLARDNWLATQFHPEKSGQHGLRLYRNFLEWAGALEPTPTAARR